MRSLRPLLLASLAVSWGSGCIVYDPALVQQRDDASAADAGRDASAPADAGLDASASDAGPAVPTFALLSLNLHCLSLEGTPYTQQSDRFAAIAQAAVAEGALVLALQEVCDDGTTDALTLMIDALEAESGEGWSGHSVFAHRAFAGTADEADEHVAIVARSIRATGELVHRRQGALRRVAAAAEVGVDGGSIHVLSVHFDHLDEVAREAQAREAAVRAMVEADPSLALVVAGDFNAREGQPPHAALLAAGFRDRSAGVGLARIDHVFTHRGSGLVTREARVLFDTPETRVADHPGVLVVLARATPEDVLVTRITAGYRAAGARTLYIRGSSAPLSWEQGWPMLPLSGDRWRWITTELSAPFELKAILDDDVSSWQLGANVAATAGTDLDFSPAF